MTEEEFQESLSQMRLMGTYHPAGESRSLALSHLEVHANRLRDRLRADEVRRAMVDQVQNSVRSMIYGYVRRVGADFARETQEPRGVWWDEVTYPEATQFLEELRRRVVDADDRLRVANLHTDLVREGRASRVVQQALMMEAAQELGAEWELRRWRPPPTSGDMVWNTPNGSRIVGIDPATNTPTFQSQENPIFYQGWIDEATPRTWDEVYARGAERAAERTEQQILATYERINLSPDQEISFQGELTPLQERTVDGMLNNYARRNDERIFSSFNIPQHVFSPDQPVFGRGIMPRLAEEQRQAETVTRAYPNEALRRLMTNHPSLLNDALQTAHDAIERAFEETENGLNYKESVAVETPNGVLFINLNFQPNRS